MATPFLAGDYFRYTVYNRWDSKQNMLNILVYKVLSITGAGADEPALAAGVSGQLATLYKGILASSCAYDGLKQNKVLLSPTVPTVSRAGAGVGTKVTDSLPPQTVPLIKWAPVAGAPARTYGLTYLPCGAEGDSAATGAPTAGAVTAYNTMAASLLLLPAVACGVGTTCNLVLQIRHRVGGLVTYFDAASGACRDRWATQRRRSGINKSDGPL